MDDMQSLPIIDISPFIKPKEEQDEKAKQNVAKQLHEACAEWGFFYVGGHGVDPKVVDGALELARQFFASDEAKKKEISITKSQGGGVRYDLQTIPLPFVLISFVGVINDLVRTSHSIRRIGTKESTFIVRWRKAPYNFQKKINKNSRQPNTISSTAGINIQMSLPILKKLSSSTLR